MHIDTRMNKAHSFLASPNVAHTGTHSNFLHAMNTSIQRKKAGNILNIKKLFTTNLLYHIKTPCVGNRDIKEKTLIYFKRDSSVQVIICYVKININKQINKQTIASIQLSFFFSLVIVVNQVPPTTRTNRMRTPPSSNNCTV